MIKVTCDMCGCEIDYELNGVNIDFNHYGVVKFKPTDETRNKEFQLCTLCAKKVFDFVNKDEKQIKNEQRFMGDYEYGEKNI